jgi:hypothetical protein
MPAYTNRDLDVVGFGGDWCSLRECEDPEPADVEWTDEGIAALRRWQWRVDCMTVANLAARPEVSDD